MTPREYTAKTGRIPPQSGSAAAPSRKETDMNANEWTTTQPTEPGEYWCINREGEQRVANIVCLARTVGAYEPFVRIWHEYGKSQSGWLDTTMFFGYRWQKIVKPTPPPRPKPLSEDAMEERRAVVEWCNREVKKAFDHQAMNTWFGLVANAIERGEHRK